jgi:hypothetical protein
MRPSHLLHADWSDEDEDAGGQAVVAAGTGAGRVQQQQLQAVADHAASGGQDELDDDELLDLVEQDMQDAQGHAAGLEQHHGQQQQKMDASTGPVAAAADPPGGGYGGGEFDDDELLDLLENTYTDSQQQQFQQHQQQGQQQEGAAAVADGPELNSGAGQGGNAFAEEGLEDDVEEHGAGTLPTAVAVRQQALEDQGDDLDMDYEGLVKKQQQPPRKRLRKLINDSSDDEDEEQGAVKGPAAAAAPKVAEENVLEVPRGSGEAAAADEKGSGDSKDLLQQASEVQPAPDGSIPPEMLRFALLETAPDDA